MTNILAAIGAITVAVRIFIIARWFWKTRNWKPTPWLIARYGGGK